MAKRKFYYDTGKRKVGPVSGNDLLQLRESGEIADDTWVRRDGSETWRPLASVDLSEEEEEEANPSLWSLLRRHVSIWQILLFCAIIFVLIVVLVGAVTMLWPLLLVLAAFWLISQAFNE